MRNNEGLNNDNFVKDSIENIFGKLLMNRGSLGLHALKNITLCIHTFRFIDPTRFKFIIEKTSVFNSDVINDIKESFDNYGLNEVRFELLDLDFSNFKNLQVSSVFYFINEMNIYNLAYKEGFDQLIILFSKQEGNITSEHSTPESIRNIYKLLVSDSKSILDPACGTGGLLNAFKGNDNNLLGQEINKYVSCLAKLRFLFDTNVSIEISNSLQKFDDSTFDTVAIVPPFNMRIDSVEYEHMPYLQFGTPSRSNANFYWLQYGLSKLNGQGKSVILLSNSSQNSSGADAEIRSKLIQAGLVEAIISLPSNLFDFTIIPATIWVLNKKRIAKDSVLFIDTYSWGEFESRNQKKLTQDEVQRIGTVYNSYNATNHIDDSFNSFAKIVNVNELANNNFILTPNRYLSNIDGEFSDGKNLEDLRNFLTPINRSIPSSPNLKIKKISVKDLSSSSDQFTININSLDDYNGEHRVHRFDDEVVIMAKVGDKLKPSHLPYGGNETSYCLLNVFAFAVNCKKINIDYLIQELNKAYIYKQLNRYRSHGTIPNNRLDDLLSLKINFIDITDQEKVVKDEREIRFQELAKLHGFENEIIRLKELQRKDLGSKKHNIMQHLNNVKSSSEIIRKMLIKNNGSLNATDVINPTTGITVEDRLVKLQESIESVLYFVDNLTNEISFDKLEVVNLQELINECIQKGIQNDHFEIIDKIDLVSFEDSLPNVEISKRDFEELYNNILENAINHGFINPDTRYIFRISVAIINNQVELLFENNGKPFPKGMGAIQMYSTRGEKAGVTANTGEGSWKVAQIANYFNAELSIIDEPENEYPVGIKLIFKLSE
jgi:type I restriction enzyme M protein